jgi:hypothetical protein
MNKATKKNKDKVKKNKEKKMIKIERKKGRK